MTKKSNINSFPSKLDLTLDVNMPHLKDLSHQLGKEIGLRDVRQQKTLRVLLCNMVFNGANEVMVSLKNKASDGKKYNPLNIGPNSKRRALNLLEEAGYIIQKKGDFTANKRTTMLPTDKLIKWFRISNWSIEDIEFRVGSYITLRKNKKDNNKPSYVDFEDTKYSIWLSEELKKYNQLLSETKLTILSEDGSEEEPLKKTIIRRAFIKHNFMEGIENTEFIFGGRMYGPWIDYSQEVRKRIRINGGLTTELDRKASHLNAMYQVITGKPCSYDDAYDLTIGDIKVPRHIAKNFCSFMQGSSSPRGTAQRVFNHYKYKALEVDNPKQKDVEKHKDYVRFKKKVKPTAIVEAILKRHPKVGKSYMKGKAYGDFIGCWESDLVFEVVMELTRRGIPCLTVYDSFVVPLQYKELVDSIKDNTPYVDRRGISKVLPK